MNQVVIQPVSDASVLQEVFRLRYQVYVEEFGDERFADHAAQQYSDSDDTNDTILLVARCVPSDAIVGTIRLKPLSRREFLTSELFDFAQLASALAMDTNAVKDLTVLLDRGVVASSHRRLGVMNAMLCEAERWSIQLGCQVLLLAVAEHNIAAEAKFLKYGFSPFRSSGVHQGLTCNHFYKSIANVCRTCS